MKKYKYSVGTLARISLGELIDLNETVLVKVKEHTHWYFNKDETGPDMLSTLKPAYLIVPIDEEDYRKEGYPHLYIRTDIFEKEAILVDKKIQLLYGAIQDEK